MPPKLQLIGQKFTRLLVISKDIEKSEQTHKTFWQCKCDCGNLCSKKEDYLRWGNTKSCGCLQKEHLSRVANNNRTGYGYITGSRWDSLKNGARQRNIKFLITIQEASDLLEKQEFKCALTGEPLTVAKNRKECKAGLETASLDRIDSSKDYTIDNIRWIHQKVNYMKLDHTNQEFLEWCTKVSNNFPETPKVT